jgi:hypothetical protein
MLANVVGLSFYEGVGGLVFRSLRYARLGNLETAKFEILNLPMK